MYGEMPKHRKTVEHEMMHLLGFQYEHQWPDHDCNVKITYSREYENKCHQNNHNKSVVPECNN